MRCCRRARSARRRRCAAAAEESRKSESTSANVSSTERERRAEGQVVIRRPVGERRRDDDRLGPRRSLRRPPRHSCAPAIAASVPVARCGPCCSVEPTGTTSRVGEEQRELLAGQLPPRGVRPRSTRRARLDRGELGEARTSPAGSGRRRSGPPARAGRAADRPPGTRRGARAGSAGGSGSPPRPPRRRARLVKDDRGAGRTCCRAIVGSGAGSTRAARACTDGAAPRKAARARRAR